MKPSYRPLSLHRLDRGIRHARPKQQFPRRVIADDPALSVMTDLCQVAAVTTELSTPLGQGLERHDQARSTRPVGRRYRR